MGQGVGWILQCESQESVVTDVISPAPYPRGSFHHFIISDCTPLLVCPVLCAVHLSHSTLPAADPELQRTRSGQHRRLTLSANLAGPSQPGPALGEC